MSVETWKSFFDTATVVLLFLTFLAGAGVLLSGNVINRRQAGQLKEFDAGLTKAKTDLAAQQERAANAEGQIVSAQREAAEASAKAEKFRLDIATANAAASEANERTATLELESLKLREQLVAQGPRESILRGEIRKKLIDALKPFAGQKVDVRRSASVIEVNGSVVMSTPIGDDTIGLSQTLVSILREAGWNSPSTPLLSDFQGQGLKVEIAPGFSAETLRRARVLADALRAIPLATEGPLLDTKDQWKRVGTEVVEPAFDENTIIVTVLTHP